MTKSDAPALSGEERLKARRRKFWRYVGLALLAALVAGLAMGVAGSMFQHDAVPMWVPVVLAILTFIGMVWFTFDYYRRIDEIDLMDNFWAHLIGLNVGAFAVGFWWLMADIGLLRMPSALEAVGVIALVTVIAYGARKLGWR